MKKLKPITLILFALSYFLTFLPSYSPASAAGTDQCQPIYGGGETCLQAGNISVNKTVQDPQTGEFVDNLGVSDNKYGPGQTIQFEIVVKNTTNTTVSNITVKDIFPQYLNYSSGPGSFDKTNKTLTTTIDQLTGNQSKTLDLQGTIVGQNELPQSQGIICVVNQAQASQSNQTSQDNAQFCIQREVLNLVPSSQPQITNPPTTKGGLPVFKPAPTRKTPPTGPEDWAIFGLLPTGALGYLLRRKTK